MLNKRHLLAGLAVAVAMAVSAPLAALDKAPFDAKAFEAAQAAGKPILLEVHASWCPICKAQTPILARLSSTPKFQDMVRFNIDFDTQKDLLRKFNVQKQSTLIAFKGKQEVA